MTKQELEKELSKSGMFLSVSEISRITGMKRETVMRLYLSDLDYIQVGRAKKFFVSDVAKSLFDARRHD